ncbi:MAG: phosphotransferase [Candidatus Thorarchaeota archaeon]
MSNQVSYQAFVLRMKSFAKKALERYGIRRAELRLKTVRGNGLYQVIIPQGSDSESTIPPGRYALRLHQPGYMKPEYITSELEWLSALRAANIEVPTPFKNLDGEWLTRVEGKHEIPSPRTCTLLSWATGRLLSKNLRPHHLRSLGKLVGRMHEQSVSWTKPKGFKRPHWDWEGLYGDGFDYGVPAKDAREAIPKNHQEAFNDVLMRVQEASQQMGKGKRVYGLIHADLGVDDNVAFQAGEARPFDFDDCGFAYWVFDLGVALAHYIADCEGSPPKLQDALIEGYQETSPLPESNLVYLDLFIAARYAQLMFFYQGASLRYPALKAQGLKEINHYGKHLKQLLKKMKRLEMGGNN